MSNLFRLILFPGLDYALIFPDPIPEDHIFVIRSKN